MSHPMSRTTSARRSSSASRPSQSMLEIDADRQLLGSDRPQQCIVDGSIQPTEASVGIIFRQDAGGSLKPVGTDFYPHVRILRDVLDVVGGAAMLGDNPKTP